MPTFIKAVFVLSGMIIGVGMFGIPFSFAQAGFWLGAFELLILFFIILTIHLLYGELVVHKQAIHRLPGYIKVYLGKEYAFVAWISAFVGICGTLLAYIILGSFFLKSLLNGYFLSYGIGFENNIFWTAVIVFFGAFITFFPIKKEAAVNTVLTAMLLMFILGLVFILVPKMSVANLSGIQLSNAFVPYGVLLFALSGGVVIPDVIAILGKERKKFRYAVFLGTLIPALVYFLLSLIVVGVSGDGVSEDAISGLLSKTGRGVVVLGSIIGFLAVITSFITLLKSFQELLRLDFGISFGWAWIVSFSIPTILYVIGFRDFINIISFVGAVALGIDSLLIILASQKIPCAGKFCAILSLWRWVVLAIFIVGIVIHF